ncbi:NADPH-dependent curcumin reductase CurA [Novosphingobium hassiacum]|uniref:NADPH-dependent curcumin reductase CurA n=1 Tax=Novosphingobium hassiacum TaxID=173676 RepID=A0A7W5ZUT0_9SPHN|nr:NADP-dependent oxidoreductase [Novosphingobium hassiacum]MBB3858809.1 NADPH-dependent curcumin reductase CurA [Novosphingobium hassiacum]
MKSGINRQWLLARRPQGNAPLADFEYREGSVPDPASLQPGELLVRNRVFLCVPTGETLVVSGAVGSTGSMAARIGKIVGCRVIGIAGGSEKCAWLTESCGLDAAIDYRQGRVAEKLADLCPNGIDVFFDNVGGDILQAAVDNMASLGRIVLCGQIASYTDAEPAPGPSNMMRIIYGGITIQGFLQGNYADEAAAAVMQLREWEKEGKITHREDVRTGFAQLPEVFGDLFAGSQSRQQRFLDYRLYRIGIVER